MVTKAQRENYERSEYATVGRWSYSLRDYLRKKTCDRAIALTLSFYDHIDENLFLPQ